MKVTGDITVQGACSFPGGITDLAAGQITNTEVSATAAIARSKLAQDDLLYFGVNLTDLRIHDAPASFLPTTAASDDLGLIIGTFGSSSLLVQTSDADNTTVTQYARFFTTLPYSYVSGQTVAVETYAGMETNAANGTATIDIQAYESDGEGGVSSDLCITSPQSINSLTYGTDTFQLTQTSLAAGDLLDVRITIAVTDSATGAAVLGSLGKVWIKCDVKG